MIHPESGEPQVSCGVVRTRHHSKNTGDAVVLDADRGASTLIPVDALSEKMLIHVQLRITHLHPVKTFSLL
jgi:hypothetical protein